MASPACPDGVNVPRMKRFASPLCAALGVAFAFAACASSGQENPDGGGAGGPGGSGVSFGTGGPGQTECDDAGQCSCVRIASIGLPGHYGIAGDDTTAFTDWLTTKSTASVAMYTSQPTLTADFLSQYDVLIIQWLTDSNTGPYWTFSTDEISALETWVQAGGGLITLSGYDSNSQEVTPLNQLLSFTDISYNPDTVLGTCPGSLCYCWGNSIPLGGWAPSPLGAHVQQIGAFDGRSIQPGSATVDCSDPSSGLTYAVHETVGQGRIVAYTDEWITYSSQWLGTAPANNGSMYTDPNNPCYDQSAAEVFQVPQFWFNVLSWASGGKSCFTISDPGVVQ
jgi:hypothetical protein